MSLGRRLQFGLIGAVTVLLLLWLSLFVWGIVGHLSRHIGLLPDGMDVLEKNCLIAAVGFAVGLILAPAWARGTRGRMLAVWIAPGAVFAALILLDALAGAGRESFREALVDMMLALAGTPFLILIGVVMDPVLIVIWTLSGMLCWEIGKMTKGPAGG